MEIIIIAAMAKNGVIGKDGVMPWSIKEDMKHFTELTKGWPCIMGRITWDSLFKKPLPGRLNIVISRDHLCDDSRQGAGDRGQGTDVVVCNSIDTAIEYCSSYEKIFIIGGESIYKQAMDIATKIELTLIHKDYDGDTFFPEMDFSIWKEISRTDHDTFSFITYTKN